MVADEANRNGDQAKYEVDAGADQAVDKQAMGRKLRMARDGSLVAEADRR
jgi:hypothetical protein